MKGFQVWEVQFYRFQDSTWKVRSNRWDGRALGYEVVGIFGLRVAEFLQVEVLGWLWSFLHLKRLASASSHSTRRRIWKLFLRVAWVLWRVTVQCGAGLRISRSQSPRRYFPHIDLARWCMLGCWGAIWLSVSRSLLRGLLKAPVPCKRKWICWFGFFEHSGYFSPVSVSDCKQAIDTG